MSALGRQLKLAPAPRSRQDAGEEFAKLSAGEMYPPAVTPEPTQILLALLNTPVRRQPAALHNDERALCHANAAPVAEEPPFEQ